MSAGAVRIAAGDVEGGVHVQVEVGGEVQATLCLNAEECADLIVQLYCTSGQRNSDLARNFRASQAMRS